MNKLMIGMLLLLVGSSTAMAETIPFDVSITGAGINLEFYPALGQTEVKSAKQEMAQ